MALARRAESDPATRTDAVRLPATLGELQDAQRHTALMLARAAESKDPTTGSHIERVYGYTLLLARSLGFGEEEAEEVATASMLHDVGKLAVPNRILQKPGPLTPEEWRVVRRHPAEGAQILGGSPLFGIARDVVRWHHEWWDGSGYPDGLRGAEIPLHVAVVAIADVYDALISRRCYKPPWEEALAIAELQRIAGRHLHPDAVAAFSDLWDTGALAGVTSHDSTRPA